jgi:hypothetical protein
LPRGSHAYSGTLRYWHGLPPFHPSEWSLDELRQFTSIDVIQLAGATLRVRIVVGGACGTGTGGSEAAPSARAPRTTPSGDVLSAASSSDAEGQPAAIATPRSPEIKEIVELELLTPRARFPKYVLRADTPEEARAWAASIAQHIWPLQ